MTLKTTQQERILNHWRGELAAVQQTCGMDVTSLTEVAAKKLGVTAKSYRNVMQRDNAVLNEWGPLSPWWKQLVEKMHWQATRAPVWLRGPYQDAERAVIADHARAVAAESPNGMLRRGAFLPLEPVLWRRVGGIVTQYMVMCLVDPTLPRFDPKSVPAQETRLHHLEAILRAGCAAVKAGAPLADETQPWLAETAKALGVTAHTVVLAWRTLKANTAVHDRITGSGKAASPAGVEAPPESAMPPLERRVQDWMDQVMDRLRGLGEQLERLRAENGQAHAANTARLVAVRSQVEALYNEWVDADA